MFSILISKIAFLAQNYQMFWKIGGRKFASRAHARKSFGEIMPHKYVSLRAESIWDWYIRIREILIL